jgi:hypothetical protein
MELDPRMTPRLRDRALDRLNGLTTGAAALGVIATAGFGTVAAMTTHVPGVSATDSTNAAEAPDDTSGGQTFSGNQGTTNPTTPRTNTSNGSSGGSQFRNVQPPANSGNVSPNTGITRHRHASTGGS